MHGLEAFVVLVADFAQIVFEAASILAVSAGGAAFSLALIRARVSGVLAKARQVLAKYLIIALELQLAADIIATATDPSLQEIAKLAAIAVIRTFLNYFLVLEMREKTVIE